MVVGSVAVAMVVAARALGGWVGAAKVVQRVAQPAASEMEAPKAESGVDMRAEAVAWAMDILGAERAAARAPAAVALVAEVVSGQWLAPRT